MATKIETMETVLCDVHAHGNANSEVEATMTHEFTVDGKSYRLDLCDPDEAKFQKALKPFMEQAQALRGRRSGRSQAHRPTLGNDNAAIRAWATTQGLKVAPRGRIPDAVVNEYKSAHRAARSRTVTAA